MNRPPNPLGKKGEDLAAEFLRKNGYRIIERNYRCRGGEIDVIACERDTLCFVEVKSRGSEDYGGPEQAITATKKRRMTHAALFYLTQKRIQDADWRFDAVTVVMTNAGTEMELIRGAFLPTVPLP